MITTPIQVGDKVYKSPIHFASVNNISVYAVKQYMDGIWPLDVIMDPVKLAAARQELSNKTRAENKAAKQMRSTGLASEECKASVFEEPTSVIVTNRENYEKNKLAVAVAASDVDTIVDDLINLDGYYQW